MKYSHLEAVDFGMIEPIRRDSFQNRSHTGLRNAGIYGRTDTECIEKKHFIVDITFISLSSDPVWLHRKGRAGCCPLSVHSDYLGE